MSNVLPNSSQKAVWHEYRARFVLVGSIVASLVALVALVPSYLALRVDEGSLVPATSTPSAAQDGIAMAHLKVLVTTLSPLAASSSPVDAMTAALANKPAGIVITHLTYTAGSPASLVLSGTASDTQTLNAYQMALRANSRFTAASVPIDQLAGAGNGQFTLTVSGTY